MVGAALLVSALVILAAGPRTTFRAEASFTISRPLLASEVVAEIRLSDVNARSLGAQGVEAHVTADDRAGAHRRVVEIVQRAVDECVATASTTATRRAAASQADARRAASEAAALTAARGVTDPQRAYRQSRDDLKRLETKRTTAKARGRPVADLDIRIASTQEKVFDLKFLVSQLAALGKQQARATRDAAAAARSADDARAAAASVKRDLHIAESRSAGWQGAAPALGGLGLVFAAVPAFARRRRARPVLARVRVRSHRRDAQVRPSAPPAPMSVADAILVEETLARARARRAGAAAAPRVEDGHSPVAAEADIDLVAEERVETRRLDVERPLGSS